MSAKDFIKGKVCYLLNERASGMAPWRQTLGTDNMPLLAESHDRVICHRNSETDQIVYNNSMDEPEKVTITLYYNDNTKGYKTIRAYRQHSEDEAELAFVLNSTDILFPNTYKSEIVKWTERANGQGSSYKSADMIKPYQDMTLYAQWDNLEICIPKTENIIYTIPESVRKVKLYCHNGPKKGYENGCSGSARLIFPTGYMMRVSGTVTTDGTDWFGRERDYLDLDGTRYSSSVTDQSKSISAYNRSSNEICAKFVSDNFVNSKGVDITIEVLKPEYHIKSKEDFIYCVEKSGDIYLDNDIDLGKLSKSFVLSGNFDGGGHTITYSANYNMRGLFKEIKEGASLDHLRVEANVVTSVQCGGIAETNNGSISDCHFSGSINKMKTPYGDSQDGLAGIAAVNNGYIDHCSATGTLALKKGAMGRVYPITNSGGTPDNYCTWIDPANSDRYAAQTDSALNVQDAYPVYAKGILDVTKPKLVMGNETIDIVGKHLESLTIVDGERFSCSTDVTVDNITYKRRGTNGTYQPWILPFDYTIDASMFSGDMEFYYFTEDNQRNITVKPISADHPYPVAANEPLVFRTSNAEDYTFQMKLKVDGNLQPMTIRIPSDGVAAMLSSNKDMARMVVSYDSIAAERASKELMYLWNDSVGDFILGNGEKGMLPFRYCLQYVDKATGKFETYEQTDWARRKTSGSSARSLAKRKIARRASLYTLTAEGWQAIFLDPRGSQEVTAQMLEDYDILYLSDLYDEKLEDNSIGVALIYEPAVEGTTLYMAHPLLVRAKRDGVEPLVTEQMGSEIDALLTEAMELYGETPLDSLHYWYMSFAGRYDVWQIPKPENDRVLNEFGALVFSDKEDDQHFYYVGDNDGYSMQPMSYCFTAYDSETFENLPLANDRIEIIVFDSETTGIEDVNLRPDPNSEGRTYNLKGQKVNDTYRGIIIKNGKKIFKRK